MGSNSVDGSTRHESIVSVALLLILLGVFGVFATMPGSQLEAGSGTGNYGLPGHGSGTTSPSGTGTTAPGGNTATIPPATVDILAPVNDTAGDSP
jgi:hypothetical protein